MQKLIEIFKELISGIHQDRSGEEEVQISGREQLVELHKKGLSIPVFTL